MTGWGQDGPLAQAAGHDMNYIAITGALFGLGQDPDRPHFPTNLVGDFGGGSTYLVIGVLAALLEARLSGQGQVVDAAIVDGTAHLNAMTRGIPGQRRATGGARRPTCSTAASRSTTSTRPPTASTCRSGRSSRSSTPRSSSLLGHRGHRARPRRPGQRPASCATLLTDAVQASAPRPSGSSSSRAPTPASRRCCRSARRPSTRTSRRAAPYVEREGVLQPAPAPRFSRTAADADDAAARGGRRPPARRSTAWGVDDVDGPARLRSRRPGPCHDSTLSEHVDVVVIGAGLSGMGAAAHLTRGAPAHVVRRARGARGQRRHVGPLPLTRASARTRTCMLGSHNSGGLRPEWWQRQTARAAKASRRRRQRNPKKDRRNRRGLACPQPARPAIRSAYGLAVAWSPCCGAMTSIRPSAISTFTTASGARAPISRPLSAAWSGPGNIDPKAQETLNGRVHACWLNPGLEPTPGEPPPQPPPPATSGGTTQR